MLAPSVRLMVGSNDNFNSSFGYEALERVGDGTINYSKLVVKLPFGCFLQIMGYYSIWVKRHPPEIPIDMLR